VKLLGFYKRNKVVNDFGSSSFGSSSYLPGLLVEQMHFEGFSSKCEDGKNRKK
jgi:hypothetical protein